MGNIKTVEKRLLKYLPKAAISSVVWLDHEHHSDGTNTYWLVYADQNGEELSSAPIDSVAELRYAGKALWESFNEGSRDKDWR